MSVLDGKSRGYKGRKLARMMVLIISGLVAVLLVVALGGFLYLRTSLPQMNGSIALTGLNQPVEIIRDSNAVPHIFAKNAEDGYFGLGFVHAQDRLWQMEFMRRLGAGRLAEVLGEPALKYDRFLRTLGLYRLAEKSYDELPSDVRRSFDSYAAGVNAWLRTRTGALPPEFLLLGVEPEPWRPADSLVWGRLMAIRLGRNWRTEALRAQIADALAEKSLSTERLEQLWHGSNEDAPSTIESRRHAARLSKSLLASIPIDEVFGGASNAWVLHGSRTHSGKPLLANDPHLAFGAPVLWYLAHIEAPGLSVTGVTHPGSPLTVLGHNKRTAWGFTNGYGDNEDLFVETLDPHNADAYLTIEGPRTFEIQEEKILVKGGDPVHLIIRETYHGPVITDVSEDADKLVREGNVISLSSPAFRADDRTVESLYAINRAQNWTDFLKAAGQFHTPQQNLMFASSEGDIGFVVAGRVPIRKSGDGQLPVPGKDGIHDWQGFIPPYALPQVLNPPSGQFVNANNRSVPADYPYLVATHWPASYRAERILELLDAMNLPDIDDMAAMQADDRSLAAERLLPLMLKFEPREERTRDAVQRLARWDYSMRRDRAEPLIYAAWLRQLIVALIDDELGTELTDGYLKASGSPALGLVETVLTKDFVWCKNHTSSEQSTCADLLEITLQQALDEIEHKLGPQLESWRWGDLHHATFMHGVLKHVPVVRWFANLSIESDGGDHTVNRGTTPRARPGSSFKQLGGSSLRAIYDLDNLDNSRFITPTGQSGNLLSPHYRDFLERWRDGEYVQIRQKKADLMTNNIGELELRPNSR